MCAANTGLWACVFVMISRRHGDDGPNLWHYKTWQLYLMSVAHSHSVHYHIIYTVLFKMNNSNNILITNNYNNNNSLI